MMAPSTCLEILWALWFLVWLLASSWTARTVARQSAAARLAYTLPMMLGSVLLFFRPDRFGPLAHPLFPAAAWVAWVGVMLAAGGLGFTGWARLHIGRFWSGSVALKEDHALIRTGPYAMTRHPIYTGLLVALIGTTLAHDSAVGLAGLLLLVAGILVKVRQEERLLLSHFGAAYETYRAEVPALIPRLW